MKSCSGSQRSINSLFRQFAYVFQLRWSCVHVGQHTWWGSCRALQALTVMQWWWSWFAWMRCWQVKTMMYSCHHVRELKHAAICHCDCVRFEAYASVFVNWQSCNAFRQATQQMWQVQNGTWSTLLSDPPGCTVLAVRRSMPCLRWNNAHNISRLLQSAAVQASNSCRASRKLFHVRHYSKWVYIIDAYIWSAYSLHMYVHMLTTHGNVS